MLCQGDFEDLLQHVGQAASVLRLQGSSQQQVVLQQHLRQGSWAACLAMISATVSFTLYTCAKKMVVQACTPPSSTYPGQVICFIVLHAVAAEMATGCCRRKSPEHAIDIINRVSLQEAAQGMPDGRYCSADR
jgi:hypothetical protein